ncbi:hypothetical protein ACFL1E_00940 [Candidatus Omnitrophota bacterium]
MKKLFLLILFMAMLCNVVVAQEEERKSPASGKEVAESLAEMHKKFMPTEEEFRELQKETDCPDCVPFDITKMGGDDVDTWDYSQLTIEHAFMADNGDYYVTFKFVRDMPLRLKNIYGFWISERVIYPIQARGGSIASNKIRATLSDAERKEHIGDLALNQGILTITCAGQAQNLEKVSALGKEELIQKIISKEIRPINLSNVRMPQGLFKIWGTDAYIYYDTTRFRQGYQNRFFMGAGHALNEYEIENFYYFKDGGTTIIEVKDKGTLYIPQRMFPGETKKPYWQPVGSDEKQDIEELKLENSVLEGVGIDVGEFEIPRLKNPCDVFTNRIGS